jgi:hypothetical protein
VIILVSRSILDELDAVLAARKATDRESIIESRANNIITSAINLLEMIHKSYPVEVAEDLEKRFLNSIRGRNATKMSNSLKKIKKQNHES